MNNDQFQNQSNEKEGILFDTPLKKNAKYYRMQARQRLKQVFGIALLVTLLASLLGGVNINSSPSFDFSSYTLTDENEDETVYDENSTIAEILEHSTHTEQQILTFAKVIAIGTAIGMVFFIAFALLVSSPIKLGYRRFLLETADENAPEIRVQTLFRFFKQGYSKSICLNVLHSLLQFATLLPLLLSSVIGVLVLTGFASPTAFLNTPIKELLPQALIACVIVVGGSLISAIISIPVTYMYDFAYIIMADCPNVSAVEALRASRTLMKGNKRKLFCLDFSFIGWYLLASVFTCGIGTLLVIPYHYTARALFYHDIAQRDTAKETEFPSIDPDGSTEETL